MHRGSAWHESTFPPQSSAHSAAEYRLELSQEPISVIETVPQLPASGAFVAVHAESALLSTPLSLSSTAPTSVGCFALDSARPRQAPVADAKKRDDQTMTREYRKETFMVHGRCNREAAALEAPSGSGLARSETRDGP